MDFIKSKVLNNKKLNYKFRLITLKSMSNLFVFKEGQFVNIKINETIFRCYSIASTQDKLPNWQILLDTTPNGTGCKYLSSLKRGDVIQTSIPTGIFHLYNSKGPILLGATGCGLASIMPMLNELAQKKCEIYLYFGLRYEKDIIFDKLLATLSKKYKDFKYTIILSRPKTKKYKKGHITNYIYEKVRELNNPKTSIYLCGNSAMIDEVRTKLSKDKPKFDKIYFESYYQDGKFC